jgi:hypothetical protein
LSRKEKVLQYTGNKDKGMIVIIKPSKKSNYRNLVDILDEMAIVNVPTYAIVNEFTPEETKLLGESGGAAATPAATQLTLNLIKSKKEMKLDLLKSNGWISFLKDETNCTVI